MTELCFTTLGTLSGRFAFMKDTLGPRYQFSYYVYFFFRLLFGLSVVLGGRLSKVNLGFAAFTPYTINTGMVYGGDGGPEHIIII